MSKPDYAFRVEIVACCPKHEDMLAFHRLTLPGYEHEGSHVRPGQRRQVRHAGADGPQWRLMYLKCAHCRYFAQVSRRRLETELAAMWAPYATEIVSVVWDSDR